MSANQSARMSNGANPDQAAPVDEPEGPEEASDRIAGLVRAPTGAITPIRDVPDVNVFRFELGPAILAQLLQQLENIPLVILEDALDAKYPGFYHLHHKGEPVYIGKTSRPIGARLREHKRKLDGRQNLELDDVGVRYAYVEDPSLVDVSEDALISFFADYGLADWNQSGYGGKVTGYKRRHQQTSDWNAHFPPLLDVSIRAGNAEAIPLEKLIVQIRKKAPITFTIPRDHREGFREDHPDPIRVPVQELQFEEWVDLVERLLADGWCVVRAAQGYYVAHPRHD